MSPLPALAVPTLVLLLVLAAWTGVIRPALAAGGGEPVAATAPLVDANVTTLGCLAGVTMGALAVDLYPIYRWTFYDFPGGWMPGWVAMGTRMALGCTFGGLAGLGVSVSRWTAEAVGW